MGKNVQLCNRILSKKLRFRHQQLWNTFNFFDGKQTVLPYPLFVYFLFLVLCLSKNKNKNKSIKIFPWKTRFRGLVPHYWKNVSSDVQSALYVKKMWNNLSFNYNLDILVETTDFNFIQRAAETKHYKYIGDFEKHGKV